MRHEETEHILQGLLQLEHDIATARAEQIDLVVALREQSELTTHDVADLCDLVSEGADVAPETARLLIDVSSLLPAQPTVFAALAHGDVTFDRAIHLALLSDRGFAHSVDVGWMRSVTGLRSLLAATVALAPAPNATGSSADMPGDSSSLRTVSSGA